jgi:hypothetical protein
MATAASSSARRRSAAAQSTAAAAPGLGATEAPSSTPPRKWIVDARYDRLFLWIAWLVPIALWAVAASIDTVFPGSAADPHPPYGLLAAFIVFVLLDNSHQVATLPLTVFDPETMRRSSRVYLGGALAIGGTAIVLSQFPGSFALQVWTSLVVYWGAWHIIRQHYGFLRLYQARDKPADANLARAEVWALYSGAAFPYFLNLANGWAGADAVGATIYRVPVPAWSPWAVLAVFIASMAYVLASAARSALSGLRVPATRLLHVVLVVSNFWLGLLWFGRDNILLAVLFITSYHDVQYHAVVWLVGRKRVAPESAPVLPAVRRVFASTGVFAAAILAGALAQGLLRNDFRLASSVLPESAATAALFALFSSYSYMHYFFDSRMWKLSSDARLRNELGLSK